MSYSFTVKAASRDTAKQQIVAEFATVVAGQPSHAKDQDAAVAAACAFVDLLEEPSEGHNISVHVHGSLGWHHQPNVEPEAFTSSSVGVSAHIARIETETKR